MSGNLSPEQRQRIAENRRKALLKRELSQKRPLIEEKRKKAEAIRLQKQQSAPNAQIGGSQTLPWRVGSQPLPWLVGSQPLPGLVGSQPVPALGRSYSAPEPGPRGAPPAWRDHRSSPPQPTARTHSTGYTPQGACSVSRDSFTPQTNNVWHQKSDVRRGRSTTHSVQRDDTNTRATHLDSSNHSRPNVPPSAASVPAQGRTDAGDTFKVSVNTTPSYSVSPSPRRSQHDRHQRHGVARELSATGQVTPWCSLQSAERFQVQAPDDQEYSEKLVYVFETMQTGRLDSETSLWSFDTREYYGLMRKVKDTGSHVALKELPPLVLDAFGANFAGSDQTTRRIPQADLQEVDDKLTESLLPFQKEAVNFAVWRDGRVLLADETGLDNTPSALCIAAYYRREWPLLIVTPSLVRFAWREQISQWLPSVEPQTVNVVEKASDNCTSALINIVSYDMMVKKREALECNPHGVVIMDESHHLRGSKTARTVAASSLLQRARRVILVSDSPAFHRPQELYSQISAMDKNLFPNFHEFGIRYCDGHVDVNDSKEEARTFWNYRGFSNLSELKVILEAKVMISRLKKDVKSQLPEKIRKAIVLCPTLIKKKTKTNPDDLQKRLEESDSKRAILLDYFYETALAKMKAVGEHILHMPKSDKKILVIAHHKEMLDAIEEAVVLRKHASYVRIDDHTSTRLRSLHVKQFQSKDDVQIAILSITCTDTSMDLTTASQVIFAELFWSPEMLTRVEDLVRGFGERGTFIQYLVAKETADEYIWPLLYNRFSGESGPNIADSVLSSFEKHFIGDYDGNTDTETGHGAGPSSTRYRRLTGVTSISSERKRGSASQLKGQSSLINHFPVKKKSSFGATQTQTQAPGACESGGREGTRTSGACESGGREGTRTSGACESGGREGTRTLGACESGGREGTRTSGACESGGREGTRTSEHGRVPRWKAS